MSTNDLSSLALLASLSLHESELHGLVSGAIVCAPKSDPEAVARDVDRLRRGLCERHALEQFVRAVRENVMDPEFTYQLLVPADDEELRERVIGLRYWLIGFLEAVRPFTDKGLRGTQADFFREFHADLQQVVAIDDVDDTDEEGLAEHEESLSGILEFLRLGVMNMFELVREDEEDE